MTGAARKYRVSIAGETFPWMGKHSGYGLLFSYLKRSESTKPAYLFDEIRKFPDHRDVIINTLFKWLSPRIKKSKTYNINGFQMEVDLVKQTLLRRNTLCHLLYAERMLGLLGVIPRKMTGPVVWTVHQPVSLWLRGRHSPELIRSLDALIVLDLHSAPLSPYAAGIFHRRRYKHLARRMAS